MILRFVFILSMAAVALVGACGGGGGGGTASGSVDLFLSDAFTDDYDQVWLTVHKVEFRDDAGVFRTALDSPEGILFDARRLSDASGPRFAFLGTVSLPNGTYDLVRMTLKDEVVLVAAGSTTGVTAGLDDSLPRDGLARPMVEYPLVPALVIDGASGTEVVDFDLLNFALDGNDDVIPSLRRGDDTGVEDADRQEVEDFKGTVTGLSATGFTLRPDVGEDLVVSFGPSTPVFRGSDGQGATLANGQTVEVEGIFSVADQTLEALSIKIEDGGEDEAEAHGALGEVDLVANTLLLSDIFLVQGFTPQGTTVAVTWTDGTVFRRSGDVVDENWLLTFPFAEAEGVYDPGTNTLAASRITLEDEGGQGLPEPEARGQHVGVDLGVNTMTLTNLTVVTGFTPQGGVVNVRWDGQTVFRRSGDVVDETWLGSFAFSEVKGTYNPLTNTIAATRITIEDEDTPPGENEAEATGTVGALNLAGNSMSLSNLSAAAGFVPQGGSVTVVWSGVTEFVFKGDPVDESALATHPRAEARGTYSSATNTLTADRISVKD